MQQSFKNIPPKLYFSPSSVRFDGIGVYAAEPLPQGMYLCMFIARIRIRGSLRYVDPLYTMHTDTMLGPYYGKPVAHINSELHNEWLWEVSSSACHSEQYAK